MGRSASNGASRRGTTTRGHSSIHGPAASSISSTGIGSCSLRLTTTPRTRAPAAGLRGDLDTERFVEATLEPETTLRVAVSMRDKFVQAYQEVLRMPL